ncbi:MAG: hypothetical protein NZ879_04690 [Archaeoglobaceae archaeon]|nr:hypothetical protein [Archaeoglobaceae archaeon]MDW8118261.1 hypothetical protein [Archaeoglobaceae archaeon]
MGINTENLKNWIYEKLIPNTLLLKLDDVEVVRLLLFCRDILNASDLVSIKTSPTLAGMEKRGLERISKDIEISL